MNQENIIIKCDNCGTNNRVPASRVNERPICGKCGSPLKAAAPGTPIDITDRTFNQEVISYPGVVIVDCWAPWCGPCRMVSPVMEQIASEYSGRVKVAKINVDENPTTSSKYGIQSIPTMLIFKNGNHVDSMVGALPRQEIERHLASVL